MRFGAMGPLAVWADDGAAVPIPGIKVRALLADLLVHAGQLVRTGRLIDDLWGDAPPRSPEAALQSKVSQLRGVLEAAQPGGRNLVRHRSGGYVLEAEPDSIDHARFADLTQRAGRLVADDPQLASALLDQAVALSRGSPLAEFADWEFARPFIAQVEEALQAAIEDRTEAKLAMGEHGSVMAELDRLVREHPLRERLRGQHMRALYRAGRQAEALDSFHQLRTHLAEELGVDPGADVSALYSAILSQDPSLDPPMPAPRSGRPRTNLPSQRTDLVGRQAAVTRVRGLLHDSRLVTLTGAGGVGKTRLALETAGTLLDEYRDGVWVVELTADRPPGPEAARTWVAEQLASVLGVHDQPADAAERRLAPVDRIGDALKHRVSLLVLDNCDHVVEPLAELTTHLLSVAPDVRILATSRRPLGLTGERLWSVPPLAVPDPEIPASPERLLRFDAVKLFAQRAAAADPDFAVTADNADAVADVCRRLDGLPLALELAAARVRALPVGELAARLTDRFRLLSTGGADAPRRQQTLGALVDWSWELLSAAERAVLRRLSVFVNGATLPAAEKVVAADGVDTADVLGLLVSLVDHSLVVVEESRAGARYRLLEIIRSYGLCRLDEAGELDATRSRHARFSAEFAEHADQQLRGADQRPWLERFSIEAADLRAAVEWAVSNDPALALRLVGAMVWYWYLRGRQGEASRLLLRAMQSADSDVPAPAHANVLAWLGALGSLEQHADDALAHRDAALAAYAEGRDALGLARAKLLLGGLLRPWGEVSHGSRLIEEALAVFRRTDDRWAVAAALSVRAWIALERGDLTAARRDGHEAKALFDDIGDRWGQVRAAELLGRLAEVHGDYARATELHRTALEAAEALGLWAAAAQETSRLGRLRALAGDHAEALRLHERALSLTRQLSLEQGIVFARVGLGLITRRQGNLDAAEAHFRAVLSWHLEREFHSGTALCLAELGFIAELRDDPEHARSLHLQGLEAAENSGDPRALALALEGLAGAAAANRDAHTAATLLGAATATRQGAGGQLPPAERGDINRIAVTAAAQLHDGAYDAAFRTGTALDLRTALQIARRLPATAGSRSCR